MAILLSKDYEVLFDENLVRGVQSVSIQTSNSLEPVYGLGSQSAFSEFPTSFLTCSAEISYLISGADPFYTHILAIANGNASLSPKSIKVGNLEIDGAYITNWSISGDPSGPIQASASFLFFENFDVSGVAEEGTGITLAFAHGMFSEASGLSAITDEMFGFDYSISLDVEPIMFMGNSLPSTVVKRSAFGEVSMEGTNLAGALVLCGGDDAAFSFNAKTCDGTSRQIYNLTGKLTGRNFDASANDVIRGSAVVSKNF